jgi:transcriptional regulator with XRE-family HTH domain
MKKKELNYANKLGEQLLQLRLGAGMSRRMLSEKSGFSVTHISDIEKGRAPNLKVDTIEALLNEIGYGMAIVFCLSDTRIPPPTLKNKLIDRYNNGW